MRSLSPLEARVLGVLIEKQATVPDTYPLSLNALVSGCNQKTARWPVIEATDAEVQTAVDGLKALSLVFEGPSHRVVKFEQNMAAAMRLPSQSVALLAVLMLRGPQTSAELRQNTERLHRFADISAVEGFLEELAAKEPPRVLKLNRAPGAREARWTHLLSGEVSLDMLGSPQRAGDSAGTGDPDRGPSVASVTSAEIAAFRAEQTRMAAELDELKSQVQRLLAKLKDELGVELN